MYVDSLASRGEVLYRSQIWARSLLEEAIRNITIARDRLNSSDFLWNKFIENYPEILNLIKSQDSSISKVYRKENLNLTSFCDNNSEFYGVYLEDQGGVFGKKIQGNSRSEYVEFEWIDAE